MCRPVMSVVYLEYGFLAPASDALATLKMCNATGVVDPTSYLVCTLRGFSARECVIRADAAKLGSGEESDAAALCTEVGMLA